MRDGRVRRAYLGIAGGPRPLPPRARARLGRSDRRSRSSRSSTDSPADRAGLRPEDLIVEVDGEPVDERGRPAAPDGRRPDRHPGRVTVLRDGRELTIAVIPAELE